VFEGSLQAIINAASEVLSAVFFFFEPVGITVFWAFSLLAILRLLLLATKKGASSGLHPQNRCGVPPCYEWVLVGAFTALGAAVRFYGRDALPYWWDELLAVWIAGSDLPTLFRTLTAPAAPGSDFTPPVFYLLFHAWQGMFGQSEASARLLTASFSVLTIPAIHLLGKRLCGTGAGLGASFLLSVSMTAVSFSQQVRCYSLLALLAVLFLLTAEALYRRASSFSTAFYLICGSLFLYTHFVGMWVYAGVGAAYCLVIIKKTACRRFADSVGRVCTYGWLASVLPSGFLLAAACPLFSSSGLAQDNMRALIWIGVGLIAVIVLCAPTSSDDESRPGATDVKFLAVFSLPGLLFSPWLLHTRIWEVIAGKGAYDPNAYGLTALQSTVDFFAGLELSYAPYLLLLGLLALFVRRPRSAMLLCGWVVFATGLAMFVQNKNMNLVRYLFLTQAGYPLLMAVGCFEILDCAVAAGSWAVRVTSRTRESMRASPSDLTVTRIHSCPTALLLPLVVLALFGFVGLERISFPTQTKPSEDYQNIVELIKEKGLQCLQFENQNMLRGVSWFLQRSGLDAQCERRCRKAFLFNVYPDGRPWADGSFYVGWIKDNARLEAIFPGLAVYVSDAWPGTAVRAGKNSNGWMLQGIYLGAGMAVGRSLAYAGGQLHPTAKQLVGRGEYEFEMPECTVKRLSVSVKGQAAGPQSWVLARATLEGDVAAEAVIRGSDSLKTDLEIRQSSGETLPSQPLRVTNGKLLKVEVQLFDDGSGAIYSSNAGLAELTVTYE